ncbi:MAG: zinc ribbon domain-containing protein [Solirubrobacterales bacterium]|nr:zinc ribbon domain-containing protein [Solirubrobacterales bacterium]
MPIYEYRCPRCEARFEELVGSHVGVEESSVRCPQCGEGGAERLSTTSYAPIPRQQTANQKRLSEQKRGTDRGGARERFGKQRAAEKARSKRARGG